MSTKLKLKKAANGKPDAPKETPMPPGNLILERMTEKVSDLRPHPQNYRKHPADQLAHIKESIRRHGLYRNVVTAKDGTILAGHGVVEACKELGVEVIPTVRLNVGPDDPAALKVLTGDNEIGHLGEIDDRKLSEILKQIKDTDITGLAGTGFDEMMLANLVFVTRPDSEIANFNAAAEWAGMPGYEEGGEAVRLVVCFPDKAALERFVAEKNIRLDKTAVKGATYSTRWPWTDREDVSAIKFVTEKPEAAGAKVNGEAAKKGGNGAKVGSKTANVGPIPKRLIRIGWDNKPMPEQFERWWAEFQQMHPGWEFVTLRDADARKMLPKDILPLWENATTYASRSDILRYVAVWKLGGVYVDTDVMPLKPLDPLLEDPRPFAGLRSSKSFESAIFGAPAKHPAFTELIKKLPGWYADHDGRSASVQTGPAFFSSVLFGREDIRHLPTKTFYPYNGFMPPDRAGKAKMFSSKEGFPPEMLCAHMSNLQWGGKPK